MKILYGRNINLVLICIFTLSISQVVFAIESDSYSKGIIYKIDGKDYQIEGAPDTENGITELPGHDWRKIDNENYVGRHFNTGPFGLAKWWSSDAEDGALLYVIHAVIDEWTQNKAYEYYRKGYSRFHQLISIETGTPHPSKGLWFSHTSVGYFNLDGGPEPESGHQVRPGIDYELGPNWNVPYGQ